MTKNNVVTAPKRGTVTWKETQQRIYELLLTTKKNNKEIAAEVGTTPRSVQGTRQNFINQNKLGPDGFPKGRIPDAPIKQRETTDASGEQKSGAETIVREEAPPAVLNTIKLMQDQITVLGDGLSTLTEVVNKVLTAGATEKAGAAPTPTVPTVSVETLPVQLPGNTINMPISPTTQLLYAVVAARMQKKGVEMIDFATWVEVGMKDWCRRKGIQLGVYNLGYQPIDIGGGRLL